MNADDIFDLNDINSLNNLLNNFKDNGSSYLLTNINSKILKSNKVFKIKKILEIAGIPKKLILYNLVPL